MQSPKSTNEVYAVLDGWMDVCVGAGNSGPLSRGEAPLDAAALRRLRRGVALVRGGRVVGVVPTAELATWVIVGPLLLRASLETHSDVLNLHLSDQDGRCGSCNRPVPCDTVEQMRSRLIPADQPLSPPGTSS